MSKISQILDCTVSHLMIPCICSKTDTTIPLVLEVKIEVVLRQSGGGGSDCVETSSGLLGYKQYSIS